MSFATVMQPASLPELWRLSAVICWCLQSKKCWYKHHIGSSSIRVSLWNVFISLKRGCLIFFFWHEFPGTECDVIYSASQYSIQYTPVIKYETHITLKSCIKLFFFMYLISSSVIDVFITSLISTAVVHLGRGGQRRSQVLSLTSVTAGH